MAKRVFISYRRTDASWAAISVYDALRAKLPTDSVFMDIDSIPIGVDFVEYLDGWVRQCDIVLVMIGPNWLTATDPNTQKRRLDSENDFVRIEIRLALARGIPVVPVLLDGTAMPSSAQLPADIRPLARRHAAFIQTRSRDADLQRLVEQLRLDDGPSSRPRERHVRTVERAPTEPRAKAEPPQIVVEPLTRMRFLPVPGGTFQMGAEDLEDDCKPVHEVTVSSFWLAATPVTNAQYRPFVQFVQATGKKPKHYVIEINGLPRCISFVQATGKKPKHWGQEKYSQDAQPVVGVSWHDATAYCEWLTAQFKGSWVARLPSEAWWERAARGDDGRPYPWGSAALTPELAWYGQDYRWDAPKPVGQYPKSIGPYGHLDLAGNVWEWCQDVWDEEAYQKPPHAAGAVDPEVATGNADYRGVRGGSFNGAPDRLRAAYRLRNRADYRSDSGIGFRVCLSPPSTGGAGGEAP